MKKLFQLFLLLTRAKQIGVVVVLTHFAALFILTCHHLITSGFRPIRPMVVKTIAPYAPPNTPPKQRAAQTAAPSQSPPAPVKKTLPPKSKEPLASKPKPAPKKVAKPDLFQEMSESFDAIAAPKKSTKKTPPLPLPFKPVPKEERQEEESFPLDVGYAEFLIAYLQNTLNLPEYGEVKMEIEIDQDGKLISSRILSSKSEKNAQFLSEELYFLSFPIPPSYFGKEGKKFVVTFKNNW